MRLLRRDFWSFAGMDTAHFERIAELRDSGRLEDAIRESQVLLTETTDANEKASILTGVHVFYCTLGGLKEARQTLGQLKQLHISEPEVLLNAEFCEPTLLIQEGRYEEGLSAFVAMLDRHSEAFKEERFRYLYEDIQCRRALTLVGLSQFKEALHTLREAVYFSFNQATDEQQVHFALGVCLEDANDIEAAKQEFIRVVGFSLKNDVEERALYRLAILHYKTGALAQAKQQLETILRDFPNQSPAVPRKQVYEGLSQTYRYLGDKANEKLYMDLAQKP
jgi:tetratricopeptide (TPR) repeat protein